jgi:hypothetical protein
MQQTLLSLILLLLFVIPCIAQRNSQNSVSTPQARKFDEFDFLDNERERAARFAETLTKEPTAKGYIIVYQKRVSRSCGEVGAGSAIWFIRSALDGRLDFPVSPKRIVDIRGGLREKQMVEFFIVPKGATPPVPTPSFEPSKAVRCPCLGATIAPGFVFENTRSPLKFYTYFSSDEFKEKPTFEWSVSEGRIISGQGTTSIVVERPISEYKSITAIVEVEGFPSECKLRGSVSSPAELSSLPMKIDEFSNITCEDELARLDYLRVGINSDPLAHGYIIIYGGKHGRRNEVKAKIARVKANLRGHVMPDRVTFIDGGFREKLSVELWLGEKGKSAPIPTPTIDSKDVKLKGIARIYNEPCMQ